MARLTILTADEIDALYTIPVLDDEERAFLFVLDDDDKAYLDTLNNDVICQINYILQLGYFKARQYFFTFSLQKVKTDMPVIVRLEGTNADIAAKMLKESPLKFIVAKDLADGAKKAVAAVKQ